MIIAPEIFNKLTTSASALSDIPFLNTVPHSVGISWVPMMSFIPIGNPCSGPRGLPDFLYSSFSSAFSRRSFLSKKAQALTSFSNLSILPIYSLQASTHEISPLFNFSANSIAVIEKILLIIWI